MKHNLSEPFVFLFDRDITRLEAEIKQYPDDTSLWQVSGTIANSAGNLCLHLCGNLQYYIGSVLGKTGYVRNRDFEFAARGLTKHQLLAEIETTRQVVQHTLKNLTNETLFETYPKEVLGYPMTTYFFINHLFGHFGYHLGQINYHRRIMGSPTVESIH
jgi:uncharacterized damage-inducible protein DinB